MSALSRLARFRLILTFLAAALVCQGLFAVLFVSLRRAGVSTTLDMMAGFSYAQAREHIALYDARARMLYNWFQLVDVVFPVSYGLLLAGLVTRLAERLPGSLSRLAVLVVAPLAGAGCDLLENAGCFAMIRIYPGPFQALAVATSAAGVLKFVLLALSLATTGTLTLLRWARRPGSRRGT